MNIQRIEEEYYSKQLPELFEGYPVVYEKAKYQIPSLVKACEILTNWVCVKLEKDYYFDQDLDALKDRKFVSCMNGILVSAYFTAIEKDLLPEIKLHVHLKWMCGETELCFHVAICESENAHDYCHPLADLICKCFEEDIRNFESLPKQIIHIVELELVPNRMNGEAK